MSRSYIQTRSKKFAFRVITTSGWRWKRVFLICSPERINPGERQNILNNIAKVVTVGVPKTLEKLPPCMKHSSCKMQRENMSGYHPRVILAGRRINDGRGKCIPEQSMKNIIIAGSYVNGVCADAIMVAVAFFEVTIFSVKDIQKGRIKSGCFVDPRACFIRPALSAIGFRARCL